MSSRVAFGTELDRSSRLYLLEISGLAVVLYEPLQRKLQHNPCRDRAGRR
jgi:hypothetical protein